jgi:hypothetical protein
LLEGYGSRIGLVTLGGVIKPGTAELPPKLDRAPRASGEFGGYDRLAYG